MATEMQDDEFWPLSGKPYFDIILSKSHVRPVYHMAIPVKLHHVVPSLLIPVILTYRGREWEIVCNGTKKSIKRFDAKWRDFVNDNDLNVGDACVFELVESSSKRLKFRVQILRGDIPSELHSKFCGETADIPIVID